MLRHPSHSVPYTGRASPRCCFEGGCNFLRVCNFLGGCNSLRAYTFLENERMLDELEMEEIRNNDSLMGSIKVGRLPLIFMFY
jgi:hypothetical protein